MINITDFTERLVKLMNFYGINASTLASELGIQRSSISHLLSERNKPSLDFILKLNEKYPEATIEWLCLGKGIFPSSDSLKVDSKYIEKKEVIKKEFDLFSYNSEPEIIEITPLKEIKETEHPPSKKQIKKIIFFYEDNSFEIFEN